MSFRRSAIADCMDRDGLIAFGRTLTTLLRPDQPGCVDVYDLFIRSLDLFGPDTGLRLRLPPLPWEYLYVERAGDSDSIDGFLALNPQGECPADDR